MSAPLQGFNGTNGLNGINGSNRPAGATGTVLLTISACHSGLIMIPQQAWEPLHGFHCARLIQSFMADVRQADIYIPLALQVARAAQEHPVSQETPV